MDRPAGIYVHWPFCERKCPYCDFYTFGREHPWQRLADDYLAALLAEIRDAPRRFGWPDPPAADTIYFGGGTPSLMGAGPLGRLLAALGEVFRFSPAAEITLEVNPTTVETAGLADLLAAGVNRLSVGCQSFNDRLLAELGRVHDAATTRRALEHIRALGPVNLSLDLIFGAPTQTTADLEADLEAILGFEPDHVSAYNLTVHEGTPYARRQREQRLPLPPEEMQAAMFETIIARLGAAGLEHYEISNWARPGRHSRHNSKYWRPVDVFAFGVSAHGVTRGRRYEHPRDLRAYLAAPTESVAWCEPPADARARAGEILMLALRRVGGTPWAEIDAWAGADLRRYYRTELERLERDGLLRWREGRLALTRRGLLLADTVAEAFF